MSHRLKLVGQITGTYEELIRKTLQGEFLMIIGVDIRGYVVDLTFDGIEGVIVLVHAFALKCVKLVEEFLKFKVDKERVRVRASVLRRIGKIIDIV